MDSLGTTAPLGDQRLVEILKETRCFDIDCELPERHTLYCRVVNGH
jgi:hypothetical protein